MRKGHALFALAMLVYATVTCTQLLELSPAEPLIDDAGGDDSLRPRSDACMGEACHESCTSGQKDCSSGPHVGSSSCVGGSCRLVCDNGFNDCNGNAADGCETPVLDPSNCGSCGHACLGGLCQTDSTGAAACVPGPVAWIDQPVISSLAIVGSTLYFASDETLYAVPTVGGAWTEVPLPVDAETPPASIPLAPSGEELLVGGPKPFLYAADGGTMRCLPWYASFYTANAIGAASNGSQAIFAVQSTNPGGFDNPILGFEPLSAAFDCSPDAAMPDASLTPILFDGATMMPNQGLSVGTAPDNGAYLTGWTYAGGEDGGSLGVLAYATSSSVDILESGPQLPMGGILVTADSVYWLRSTVSSGMEFSGGDPGEQSGSSPQFVRTTLKCSSDCTQVLYQGLATEKLTGIAIDSDHLYLMSWSATGLTPPALSSLLRFDRKNNDAMLSGETELSDRAGAIVAGDAGVFFVITDSTMASTIYGLTP